MPSGSTSYSSGLVTFTSGLPVNNVTAIMLYTYTDGNGGGNSSGGAKVSIYEFQGMGPVPIYSDTGLRIRHNGSNVAIGGVAGANNNIKLYKNGTTWGIPLVSTGSAAATALRVEKGGTIYALPNATYSPLTNLSSQSGSSYAWSGGYGTVYGSGFNYGWSYGDGGSNGSGYLYSYFNQPYTLSQIVYNLYLEANGYGDNWQTWYVQYNLYYSTQPVGNSPVWNQLYEYNQGSH